MTTENKKIKRQEFEYAFCSCNRLRNTRKVAILIAREVMYKHTDTKKDKESWIILIRRKIDEKLFTLFHLYSPPGSESDFYTNIRQN